MGKAWPWPIVKNTAMLGDTQGILREVEGIDRQQKTPS
jgi:hypothetical protein